MANAHRPGTANTSNDEVPLQQEIDPFTAIIVNNQVKPIQRKRPKLSETENMSHRCAIEWPGTLLRRGISTRLRQTRVPALLRRHCLPRLPRLYLSRETNLV